MVPSDTTESSNSASDSWKAKAAESAAHQEAKLRRVTAAHERYPDSKIFRECVVLCPTTGRVVGLASPTDPLGITFLRGAPSSWVARAEQLRSLLDRAGRPGGRRWVALALRLARTIAQLNADLAPFSRGRSSVPWARRHGHYRATLDRPAPVAVEGDDEPQERYEDRDDTFGALRPFQALAPPGRSLAAQPIQAIAPPENRVSVAA